MPQILEHRSPELVLPQESRQAKPDHLVVLDATRHPTGFVVEWQISPDPVEVTES